MVNICDYTKIPITTKKPCLKTDLKKKNNRGRKEKKRVRKGVVALNPIL